MHKVLDALQGRPGVTGALVATADGIVVASRLREGWDQDAAAALVSSLLRVARGMFRRADDGALRRFTLVATRGKIVVRDVGDAYLVVTVDRHIDLDRGLLDVEAAAATLGRLGRLKG